MKVFASVVVGATISSFMCCQVLDLQLFLS